MGRLLTDSVQPIVNAKGGDSRKPNSTTLDAIRKAGNMRQYSSPAEAFSAIRGGAPNPLDDPSIYERATGRSPRPINTMDNLPKALQYLQGVRSPELNPKFVGPPVIGETPFDDIFRQRLRSS